MGQLQRDDRRNARYETVELWEIERRGRRAPQSGQRRQTGPSSQRRGSQQVRESRQEREEQPVRRPRPEQEVRQRRESQWARRSRPEREVQLVGESRRGREPQRARRPRPEREVQLIEESRQGREPQRARQSRPVRQSGQRRRAVRAGAVPYRKEEELQFLLPMDNPQAGNPRAMQSMKRRKARRRKILLSRAVTVLFIVLCLSLIYQATGAVYRYLNRDVTIDKTEKKEEPVEAVSDKTSGNRIAPPEIVEDYLEISEYSRPGTALTEVNSIFVHYTANPRTSARNNRSYFASLAQTHERAASAHLIIGYEGEVIQCIPLDEQAYGVQTRNEDSLSIECCHLAEDGSFTTETYETLIHTLAWLLEEYDLTTDDILRHYDCGGKPCPLYYVEHEDAWEQLLADVEAYRASAE